MHHQIFFQFSSSLKGCTRTVIFSIVQRGWSLTAKGFNRCNKGHTTKGVEGCTEKGFSGCFNRHNKKGYESLYERLFNLCYFCLVCLKEYFNFTKW